MSEDPLIGKILDGRFAITRLLGKGAMGAVYAAWQTSMDREVAIKVMAPRVVDDGSLVKRFLREAKVSSRLQRPSIVSVFDFGQTDEGLLYLVMELVAGKTLDVILTRDAPLPLARLIRIGVQICDALECAHDQSIVHRDLKPSNIMVLDEPVGRDLVKVLDFGLAKSFIGGSESMTVTQGQILMGTPYYMAPEAILHEELDGRSDLYALGVILYEMATGRLPFNGDDLQVVLRQQLVKPPAPLPATVPAPVQNVILRLLEKEPARRWQTAREVSDVLGALENFTRALPPPAVVSALTGASQSDTPVTAIAMAETQHSVGISPERRILPWILTGIMLLGAGALGLWYAASETSRVERPGKSNKTKTKAIGPVSESKPAKTIDAAAVVAEPVATSPATLATVPSDAAVPPSNQNSLVDAGVSGEAAAAEVVNRQPSVSPTKQPAKQKKKRKPPSWEFVE